MVLTATMTQAPALAPALWRCPGCGWVLGQIDGRRVRIRHQRRQIDAPLPPGETLLQVCDKCGTLASISGGAEPAR